MAAYLHLGPPEGTATCNNCLAVQVSWDGFRGVTSWTISGNASGYATTKDGASGAYWFHDMPLGREYEFTVTGCGGADGEQVVSWTTPKRSAPAACIPPTVPGVPELVSRTKRSITTRIKPGCMTNYLYYKIDDGDWVDISDQLPDDTSDLPLDVTIPGLTPDAPIDLGFKHGNDHSEEPGPTTEFSPSPRGITGGVLGPGGQPVPDSVLRFVPEDEDDPIVIVPIAVDGSFDTGPIAKGDYDVYIDMTPPFPPDGGEEEEEDPLEPFPDDGRSGCVYSYIRVRTLNTDDCIRGTFFDDNGTDQEAFTEFVH